MNKKHFILAPILALNIGCTTNPINLLPADATDLADQGKYNFPYSKSAVQQAFQQYFTKDRNCFQVMEQFSCFDQVPHGVPKTKYNEQLYTVEYFPGSINQTIVKLTIKGDNRISSNYIFNKVLRYLDANKTNSKLTRNEKSDKKEYTSKRIDKPDNPLLPKSQATGKIQSPNPNPQNNNIQPPYNSRNMAPVVVSQQEESMNKSTKDCMNHAKLGNQIEFGNCVDSMPSSYKKEGVKLINERANINLQKQKTASKAGRDEVVNSMEACMALGDRGDIEEFSECMAKVKARLPVNPYNRQLEE